MNKLKINNLHKGPKKCVWVLHCASFVYHKRNVLGNNLQAFTFYKETQRT